MTHVIQGALHILAPMICEREGVKLRIGGDKAYCSETEGIVLPDLPAAHDEARIYGMAFLNHELEHFEDTDFSGILGLTQAEFGLVNVLEDIRIETNRGKRFPGAKVVFEQVDDLLVAAGKYASTNESPYAVMHDYMLSALRHLCLEHRSMGAPAADARKRLCAVLNQSIVTRLDVMMMKVKAAQSTHDCVLLAKAIIAMIQEEKDKQEALPPPPESGQGGGNADANNQDSNQGQGSGQHTDSGDHSGDTQGDQDARYAPSPKGDKEGSSAAQSEAGQSDGAGLSKALAEIMAGAGDLEDQSSKLKAQLNALAQTSDPGERLSMPDVGKTAKAPASVEMVKGAESATNALQRRLKALLQAKSLSDTRHVACGSRLDTRRLTKLKTGNINIFKRRHEGLALNTAISILIDASGSMSGSRMEIAKQSALATAIAFGALKGVTVAVGVFPYGYLDYAEVMAFGDRAAGESGRFAKLSASGGTPLAQAMMHAGKLLVSRQETRKIMLVVTDGVPSQREACKSLIKDMEAMGIEMLGLGIQTAALSGLITENRSIGDTADLASTMIDLLQGKVIPQLAA